MTIWKIASSWKNDSAPLLKKEREPFAPSGPLDQQVLAEVRQGRRCYFCRQAKETSKRFSLCESCYGKVQAKAICALCGEPFETPDEGAGRYDVVFCEDCDDKLHTHCKICGTFITDGTWKGKSLCAACYVAVSRASPGLHTSQQLRRRAGRQIQQEIRERHGDD